MTDYQRVIPVQQIDRDTTAGYCEAHGISSPDMIAKMKTGNADDHWLVQLAAHQREVVERRWKAASLEPMIR